MKSQKQKIFNALHDTPQPFRFEYILLPYGQFYDKTARILKAKQGDTLRFFKGPDCEIRAVLKIRQDALCDALCRMRYGVSLEVFMTRWRSYALVEGFGKNILSNEECIIVFYVPNKL